MNKVLAKYIGIEGMRTIEEQVPNVKLLLTDFNTGLAPSRIHRDILKTIDMVPFIIIEAKKRLSVIEEELRSYNLRPLSEREGGTIKYNPIGQIVKQPSKADLPKDKEEADIILKEFRANRTLLKVQYAILEVELQLTRTIQALEYNIISMHMEMELDKELLKGVEDDILRIH